MGSYKNNYFYTKKNTSRIDQIASYTKTNWRPPANNSTYNPDMH